MKKLKNYFFIFFIFLICITTTDAQIDYDVQRIVHTSQETFQGTREENNVLVWKGIRYGQPPLGDLRFKSPQPIESCEGIKQTTQFGKIAPQLQVNVIYPDQLTDEDCLFLNIWSTTTKTKKSVMVWIHGGGFYTGSGSSSICNGANLTKKGDVVVVTINYRLGALGFLYFDELSGANKNFESNIGIKDQIAALRWVKENIEQFGGDPNNINVFGQSAGGTSVLTLMATPSAKGLFNRATVESGSPRQTWSKQEATRVTKMYLARLGISENNLSELYKIHVDTLVKIAHYMIQDYAANIPGIGSFAPTIDTVFVSPILSNSSSTFNSSVPLLIGTTKNEMNLFVKVKAMPFKPTPEIINRLIPSITSENTNRITTTYKKYPKEQTILNIMTDGVFRMPCIERAEMNSKTTPTYMYRFDWSSVPLNVMGFKACHSIDLFFVFNTFDTKIGKRVTKWANKRNIYKISNNIQQAWLNFAKTGSPSIEGVDEGKKYDTEQRATMIFDKKTKLAFDPDPIKRLSWEGVKMN